MEVEVEDSQVEVKVEVEASHVEVEVETDEMVRAKSGRKISINTPEDGTASQNTRGLLRSKSFQVVDKRDKRRQS